MKIVPLETHYVTFAYPATELSAEDVVLIVAAEAELERRLKAAGAKRVRITRGAAVENWEQR